MIDIDIMRGSFWVKTSTKQCGYSVDKVSCSRTQHLVLAGVSNPFTSLLIYDLEFDALSLHRSAPL